MGGLVPVLLIILPVPVLASLAVNTSSLNVSIGVIWAPLESSFTVEAVNRTLYESLISNRQVTILQENEILRFYVNEYQQSTKWWVFVDLREYVCPEDIFQARVLSYISVTQFSCPRLTNTTRRVWTTLDTRTFDRWRLLADLTDTANKTTGSLALFFDVTGEEYVLERSSSLRLPLVFEINVALVDCQATEQLKNLTAKTEIRNVLVIARNECISELLRQAGDLQLMFGRYRWLLKPTDGRLPVCPLCTHVNGVVIIEENRPENLGVTRLEKILNFVDDALSRLDDNISHSEESISRGDSTQGVCEDYIELFKEKMTKAEGEKSMVFFAKSEEKQSIKFNILLMANLNDSQAPVWSERLGLQRGSSSLFPHSNADIVLRAAVVIEPPFVFPKGMNNNSSYTGYSLDVLQRISEIVGFSYVVKECKSNDYGVLNSENLWTGCIGSVVRGEADVIVGALTVTAAREEVVDFTLPYYDFAGIQILMKKPDASINLFYFADVFTPVAWLCLFGVIFLTSFLLYMFEKFSPSNELQQSSGSDDNGLPRAFNLKESIWFVIGSVTLAGGGEPPRSLASRLLVAGFWFFSVVIMSTFTANLAAFLTVSRMDTGIASLDKLAAQSDIRYSVVRESNVMAYFEHQATIEKNFYELWKNMSLGGTSKYKTPSGTGDEKSLAVWDYPLGDKFGNMWSAMQSTGLLNSTQEGLEKVLEGNFALITESPVIKYLTFQDCSLTAVGDQFSIRPYAFALKEKSLFTSKFTDAILQLQKERELESLKRKWWDDRKVSCPVESSDQGLDLSSLTGTFIVMGGGLCLGLLVLGVECLISRRRHLLRAGTSRRPEKETEGATQGAQHVTICTDTQQTSPQSTTSLRNAR
ncbi:glutamate receptor ionotropic, kainate 4-like isoform X1 [Pomacea canaliculata]|uniref:glutamate receptor ionotropic, kainate 4-like isoform X1 n=1 Tax=Pomacea canaliculata TaxID=400727 RepID=UPI000D733E5D|nr:glutamate receptor ionotropic, kainate 4-like isoform X1 [Pomacea canaliculata]